MSARNLSRLVLGLSLSAVLSGSALAQYGTGGGMARMGECTPLPKGGYGSSTGIAIGAGAAAGVGLAYLVLHNHGTMVGRVEASSDGTKLISEKDKKTYALVAGNDVLLAPGERVALKGRRTKDGSGKLRLEVQKLVKDYGSCKQ